MFVKRSVRNVCNVYVKQSGAHLKCGVCWARRPVIILYQQHRWPVPPQAWWSSVRPVTRPLTKSHHFIPTSTCDLTQVTHCLWSSREAHVMVPLNPACTWYRLNQHQWPVPPGLWHASRGYHPLKLCSSGETWVPMSLVPGMFVLRFWPFRSRWGKNTHCLRHFPKQRVLCHEA